MRILHLIYTHGVAGAEKYLKHLLPGLSQYGIKCDLIVVCPPKMADVLKVYVSEVEQLGIRTTLIVATKTSVIATAWKINKYLRTNGINIVHSHLFNSDIIAALLKSLFFSRLIYNFYETRVPGGFFSEIRAREKDQAGWTILLDYKIYIPKNQCQYSHLKGDCRSLLRYRTR